MRALPLGLFAVMLTGCSLLSAPGRPVAHQAAEQAVIPPATVSVKQPAPVISVKIYTSAADLVGKPFQDLGEVSGDTCQITAQDPLPGISVARRRMQSSAIKMQANAVLQHRCEIIQGTPGCYRQAICIGSALHVPG